jgi:hypothetical protein
MRRFNDGGLLTAAEEADLVNDIAAALTAERAEGRRAERERCAAHAEEHEYGWVGRLVARRLRALADTPGEGL